VAKYGNYSDGLVILSLTLPGVPLLRSGDEVGLKTGNFNWTANKVICRRHQRSCLVLRVTVAVLFQSPQVGASPLLQAVKDVIVRRVEGIQAMHSLRYDSRDPDTLFKFADAGERLDFY